MKKTVLLASVFLFSGFVLSGQGNKGFQFVESSSGMNYPSWESGMTELEFSDINMDGFVDILSIGDHGSPNVGAQEHGIMVWFGDGTGTWSAQMTGDFGYGGIAIGDVNNDGHWDVGYGMHHNYSSSDFGNQLLEVALGDGTGLGWIPWDDGLATNGESWGLFGTDFADVDNDGDLDLGTNSFGSGSGLHVYLNQGDGTWVQSFGIMPGNSNMRFVFGDINNDGFSDFVTTHDAGIAFFGDGTGNFVNADYNLPSYSFPMQGPDLSDINKDGAQDLAFVEPDGGVMAWTFDTGTNQWINISGTLPAAGNYQEADLCDFNRDGTMDIAAFGDGQLTIWSGSLEANGSVTWSQVFTLTTAANGDCAAFRAGGDVDRNGYPDITLVQKEGSWPNDRNKLKCYKEATPYEVPSISALFPLGKEVFRSGSMQFISWISAVPVASTSPVKIEFSMQGQQGPWTVITPAIANSGRYQWLIPQTVSSNNCFLKYTLMQGTDTLDILTPEPFTILGSQGLVADFMADSTQVSVNDPVYFYDQSLGLITSWQWDFENDGTIDATDQNPVHAYTQPGSYSVKLTVSDGNGSQTEVKTDYINVLPPVHLDYPSHDHLRLDIYPNPFTNIIYITGRVNQPGPIVFELFDVTGRRIIQKEWDGVDKGIFLRNIRSDGLQTGIYFVRLQVGGDSQALKLVKW